MQIPAHGPVAMIDGDIVIGHVQAVPIVIYHDAFHDSGAGGAHRRADGHGKVVSIFLPVAMAHDTAIALAAEVRLSGLPGETVGRRFTRWVEIEIVWASEEKIAKSEQPGQSEAGPWESPEL